MPKPLLMVAWGVSPRWGSEEAVGWNWLANVPQPWSTTLLTSRRGAEQIRWGQDHNIHAPSLASVETPANLWTIRPRKMGLLLKVDLWRAYWSDLLLMKRHAERITKSRKFDLIHHTTIATWRCGMPFHSLGIPTVWGPVGGSETFPWRYLFQTSPLNWVYEGARAATGLLARVNPAVVKAIRNVDVVITTNKETEVLFRALGRVKPLIRQPNVISNSRFEEIQQASRTKSWERLKIVSGGTVEGRKGLALTIEALSHLKRHHIPFEFVVAGDGFESVGLKALVREKKLDAEVCFTGALEPHAYFRKLSESHVFSFPSLRDNSPMALIEAMAAGCVPIVLDAGGPAEVVDSECGFVLPIESPSKTVARIGHHLAEIWRNRPRFSYLSSSAVTKVSTRFLASRIPDILTEVYSLAEETHKQEKFI